MSAAAPANNPVNNLDWQPAVSPWVIACSVMLATFMEVLDTSVANVSLPHIAGNLSASTDEATWVLTSYLVSNAIVLPATGWLSNYFGRKRFLLFCIVVFTLSSGLCGMANSLGLLIFARILQGAGGGALQPIAQAVMLESFPPEKRGVAMATYAMGIIVAPIIGPTLGGWITDNYSWRWVFYINLPVGILATFMIYTFIEDPLHIKNAKRVAIDYLGFGLMALWLALLQIMLDKGQQVDWFAANWMVWMAIFTIASFAGFIIWELRVKDPIVDLRVFKDRNFAIGTGFITIMGLLLYGTIAMLPIFLQTLMGYPAVQSGMALTPRGLGSFLSMFIVGRLVGVVDNRILIGFGFLILSISNFMLASINLDISMSSIIVPNIINGLSMGFIFVPLTTITMGMLRKEQLGNATGIFNLMRNIGGGIGISLVTTLLSRGAQQHQASMASHLTPYDTNFQQRFQALQKSFGTQFDPVTATKQAYAAIYGLLVKQATLMAFIDNFRVYAYLCVLSIFLVLLFKKVKNQGGSVAVH